VLSASNGGGVILAENRSEPLFNHARRERLIRFLLDEGLAEEREGYGHATAERVADSVIEWLEGEMRDAE